METVEHTWARSDADGAARIAHPLPVECRRSDDAPLTGIFGS